MNDKTAAGGRPKQVDHTTTSGILGQVNRTRPEVLKGVAYDPMNPPKGHNPMRLGYIPTD